MEEKNINWNTMRAIAKIEDDKCVRNKKRTTKFNTLENIFAESAPNEDLEFFAYLKYANKEFIGETFIERYERAKEIADEENTKESQIKANINAIALSNYAFVDQEHYARYEEVVMKSRDFAAINNLAHYYLNGETPEELHNRTKKIYDLLYTLQAENIKKYSEEQSPEM